MNPHDEPELFPIPPRHPRATYLNPLDEPELHSHSPGHPGATYSHPHHEKGTRPHFLDEKGTLPHSDPAGSSRHRPKSINQLWEPTFSGATAATRDCLLTSIAVTVRLDAASTPPRALSIMAGAYIKRIKRRRLRRRRRAGALAFGRRHWAGKLDAAAFVAMLFDPEYHLRLPAFDDMTVGAADRDAARKLLADADRECGRRIRSSLAGRGPWIIAEESGRVTYRLRSRAEARKPAHRLDRRRGCRLPRRSRRRERRSHAVGTSGGADSDSDGDPDNAVDTGSVDGVAGEPRHEWVADRQAACMSVRCCRHAASPPDFFLPSSSPGSTDANVCLEAGRG